MSASPENRTPACPWRGIWPPITPGSGWSSSFIGRGYGNRYDGTVPPAPTASGHSGPPGGWLVPLPIIQVPFKRVGIDIVGPLPRAVGGFTHVLVPIDYATQYPEAVPLRKTSAKAIVKELLRIFSRVGFPKDVLTDQGTNFMSAILTTLWHMLKVRPLCTSVYHPQTNSLVEQFNQTLKRMLRKFVGGKPCQWAQLLDPLLFAVREMPQASTGFSPIKLLFGRKPRGLLDVLRDVLWVQLLRLPKSSVTELRERLTQLADWAGLRLQEAQITQKWQYGQKVWPCTFLPGDRVLLLLPTFDSKLLARWQGPYEVLRQTGPVDYEILCPDHRPDRQIYHVNLLKAWRAQDCLLAKGNEDWGPSGAYAGVGQPVPLGEGLTDRPSR